MERDVQISISIFGDSVEIYDPDTGKTIAKIPLDLENAPKIAGMTVGAVAERVIRSRIKDRK